jgi:hypothetical protein
VTVTLVANATIGDALTSTVVATGAVNASVGASLPEVTAKLGGYTKLLIPSPSFDIAAQATAAATALTTVTAELAALPGGAGLATGLTTAVAALIAAQLAIEAGAPSVSARIDAAVGAVLGVKAAISSGITGPNLNMATISAQVSALTALLATLQSQLALSAAIDANLGVGGLRVYRFDGDISVAGTELQARINTDGLSGEFHFVVMLPASAATWTALQAVVAT